MKKIIVAAFTLLALNSYAQVAPTTQEEYTYATKGYKVEVQNGLDVKKGYHWVDYGKHTDGGNTLNISGLIRDNETKPCAILLYYEKDKVDKKEKIEAYLCMPTSGAPSALWDSYNGSLGQLGENLKWADYYIHKLLMRFADQ